MKRRSMAARRRFSSALDRNLTRPPPLRLLADAGRRVPLDLLVIHSDREDQRKGRLPAVPGRGRPLALLSLLRQPLDDFVLADGIGRAQPKRGPKLLDAQTEFVGLFLAVLCFTDR